MRARPVYGNNNQATNMNHENFLNDTYCFYSMNPHLRGVNEYGDCIYHMPNGKRCAVGRFIADQFLENYYVKIGYPVKYLLANNMGYMLGELEHLDESFLQAVQNFHDDEELWINSQLSRAERKVEYNNLLLLAKKLDSPYTENTLPTPSVRVDQGSVGALIGAE